MGAVPPTPADALTRNRKSLLHKVRYALRHPARVPAYVRRFARDAVLRVKFRRDHVGYYRAVMASDAARSVEAAVGDGPSVKRWNWIGQMQFDYLKEHGLVPEDRILEIGCGNLRAGRHFIACLDPGNYYGIDISPDILIAAKHTVVRYELQEKLPYLTVADSLTFDFLPDGHFDVVHAHSVFSHSPLHVIEECFAHVGRILAPGGFFDFTFDRTLGREHHVLREDFYHRTDTLVHLVAKYGLDAEFMEDWEERPHGQSKIRIMHAEPARDHTVPVPAPVPAQDKVPHARVAQDADVVSVAGRTVAP
ncbi:class I SAM-dependent DNA methyltransferase [Streptomyces monticola]|uniref:Class I SAM-dependent DNA methyltransferase n=1 Tax=Streptomyces monticola TaxID=2666263 RepID=A0ABW2JY92_9ACTN